MMKTAYWNIGLHLNRLIIKCIWQNAGSVLSSLLLNTLNAHPGLRLYGDVFVI